jgi:hypothetical protein
MKSKTHNTVEAENHITWNRYRGIGRDTSVRIIVDAERADSRIFAKRISSRSLQESKDKKLSHRRNDAELSHSKRD